MTSAERPAHLPDPIEQLTPEQAIAQTKEGAVLLDVRTPAEWTAGHAPSARWIPMDEIEARIGELDPAISLIAVCRIGGRSQAVADYLSGRGFHVANLAGGMVAWEAGGLDVIDDAGGTGSVI